MCRKKSKDSTNTNYRGEDEKQFRKKKKNPGFHSIVCWNEIS